MDSFELSKKVPRLTENLALLHFLPLTLLVQIQYQVVACFVCRIQFPQSKHCCAGAINPKSVRNVSSSGSFDGSQRFSNTVNDIDSVTNTGLYIANKGCLFCIGLVVRE